MNRLFVFLLVSILLSGCSSDNDVVDNEGGVGDKENALLTISRGSNLEFYTDEIKDFTVEAVITGDDGSVLARNFIETSKEITFKADYDTNKTYDLHFVWRYIKTADDINPNDVINYSVQTFLDVSNRTYFYDLNSKGESSNDFTGVAKLNFNNIPNDLINTTYSTGFGSGNFGGAFTSNNYTFDLDVASDRSLLVYAYGETANKERRYVKREFSNGEIVTEDYNTLPKTIPVPISYPDLNDTAGLNTIRKSLFVYGFDSSTYSLKVDSDIQLNQEDQLKQQYHIPNNVFENYSIVGVTRLDDFLIRTHRSYGDINEIPEVYTPTDLRATITSYDFLNFEANTANNYDYFKVRTSYSNTSDGIAATKTFVWNVYGKATPNISIKLIDLVNKFTKEGDEFDITASDLSKGQLSIYNTSVITDQDDFVDMIIDNNSSLNSNNFSFESWISTSRAKTRSFKLPEMSKSELEDRYINLKY
ncbi:hypothetical protein [Aquimarina aquimarini]|uniref:hypothetical protein n=1 Tax=Aquimarina aquimarini TaxID=1191734 RepID=UPI000D55D511|nr:hypothetical protein [Aquimarina aquimarini]